MNSDRSGLSDLQFDRAERPNSNVSVCAVCKSPVTETYFSVNGHTVCPVCAESPQLAPQQPSKKDLLRAAVYGAGAALAGTILYFVILAVSGYELGLIAVAIGWGVGKAVQIGSRGSGGRKLQILAVVLTYCSIVGSYAPMTAKQILANNEPLSLTTGLLALAVIAAFCAVAPFLGGFSNIIGVFIIAIGLFEAWKLNRRVPITLEGPFPMTRPGPSA